MRHFSSSSSSSSRGRASAPHPSAPNRTTRPAFFEEDEEDDDPKNNNTTASKFQKSAVNVGKTPDERTKEAKAEGEDEEDDYMAMTFADTTTTSAQPETSLQRRQRLQKEGLRRGMVPSKAELAQRERERREQGLSRSLFSPFPGGGPDDEGGVLLGPKIAAERRQKAEKEQAQQQQQQDAAARTLAMVKANKSKGLAMMAKMGFTPGSALGSNIRQQQDGGEEVLVEPLRIHVRADRGGIGRGDERKRKLREEAGLPPPGGEDDEQPPDGEDNHANKKTRIVDEGDYRERMAKECDAARKERLVLAAQKIAERMDEDKRATAAAAAAQEVEEEESQKKKKKTASSTSASSRPLKAIPVLYRGLVRHREQADRDRRARHDLEQSSGFADAVVQKSLPRYAEDEDDLDAYDRMAIGREEEGEEEDSLRPGDDEKKKKKKQQPVYVPDDLDEEDDELDAFNALEVGDRLTRLVQYLRDEFRYCFWCKFAYPDEAMEGCPGITEEDHD